MPMSGACNTTDPQERAATSAESNLWSIKPPKDVRRLVARAIRADGRNKAFWVYECIRLGLGDKFGGKTTQEPVLLGKPVTQ